MAGFIPQGWVSLTAAVDRIVSVADNSAAWSGSLEATAWLAEPRGQPPEEVQHWLGAWKRLREVLCNGEIPAIQVDVGGGMPEEIPALEWIGSFGDNPWHVPLHKTESISQSILVAEDPLRVLIARLNSPAARTGRTLVGQSPRASCRDWIAALAANGDAPDSKDALFAAATARFPGLSRRGFDAAWAQSAPESWRRPGRRQ